MRALSKSFLILLANLLCVTMVAEAAIPTRIGNDLILGGAVLPEVTDQALGSSTFKWHLYTPNAAGACYADSQGKLQSLSAVSSTELGYLDGASSNLQTQINALASGTSITLATNKILVGNGASTAAAVSMSGDVSIVAGGTTAIASSAVTNAKMADMTAATFKGRASGAGTGAPTDLTASQAKTALAVACSDLTNGAASCSTDATVASNISSGTLPAARLPGLTGDVTAPIGSSTTTLPTVNSNVGSFTYASVTVNAKGQVTAASTGTDTTIASNISSGTLPAGRLPGLTGDVTAPIGSSTTTVKAGRKMNVQSGTSYTLVIGDGMSTGGFPELSFTSGSSVAVTVPANSTVAFPVGEQVDVCQDGAGKVTFAGAGGVTINSKSGNLSIGAQYVCVTLRKTAINTWRLIGDLIADALDFLGFKFHV